MEKSCNRRLNEILYIMNGQLTQQVSEFWKWSVFHFYTLKLLSTTGCPHLSLRWITFRFDVGEFLVTKDSHERCRETDGFSLAADGMFNSQTLT